MTSNNIRFEAVKMALNHEPVAVEKNNTRASVIFAQNVFTRDKMKEYIAVSPKASAPADDALRSKSWAVRIEPSDILSPIDFHTDPFVRNCFCATM